MSKPLEQRIGGPNSIKSLIERGFYAEGPVRQNSRDTIIREGIEYKVSPISVTHSPGTPNERTITIYKPVKRRRERRLI